MFLEAILGSSGGGGNVEVEEGTFEVTNSNVAATIPVQMADYNYLTAWNPDGKVYNYVYEHSEMLLDTGSYFAEDTGWLGRPNVATGKTSKQISTYVSTGTWHYIAIKLAS